MKYEKALSFTRVAVRNVHPWSVKAEISSLVAVLYAHL